MSNDISQLAIKSLLNGREDYIIPMYQRNFAWEEGEITQLLQDVMDYLPEGKNYYIGTLVVFERPSIKHTIYEIIDGQQRLTTLSLLASYLKNRRNSEDGDFAWYTELKIQFESREHSRKTFSAIFEGKNPTDSLKKEDINTAILNGYRLIQKILPQKLKENNISFYEFSEYLFEKVQIMRVKVPHDTDLNHYFEIMNNRGEQLEKHEVLKSRMLEVLDGINDDIEKAMTQSCLHVVWEACANMERYVQMGFTPKQRNAIFGEKDWSQLCVMDFDELQIALNTSGLDQSREMKGNSLEVIIAKSQNVLGKNSTVDDSPERFNTVINFPNFLLHVLRVVNEQDIPLDDKRLLTTFEAHLNNSVEPIEMIKQFTFGLLKCKYLFDQYVIKRQFIRGADGWSLKRFNWNEGNKNQSGHGSYVNTFNNDNVNRKILMLLSAFHVSAPTLVYKHWLNAALYHLFYMEKILARDYLIYLESVAKAFVFDRFLARNGLDYFTIIYNNQGVCRTKRNMSLEKRMSFRLSFDGIENNLIFNYLDYLLWLENEKKSRKDTTISTYEFTFRSSVEHYYPQHPMPGHDRMQSETLNSFGNLCLISHSKNSRLSNFMPNAKKEYYHTNAIDSVKQYQMMQFENWDETSIVDHEDAMKEVLMSGLTG